MRVSVVEENIASPKVMSPAEAAYVAGFLDGEGSLMLHAERRGEVRSGWRFSPGFSLSNTNLEVLRFCRDAMGNGSLRVQTRPKGQKVCYRLGLNPNQMRHVLPQIIPHLFLKKRRAELLLEYLWMKTGTHRLTEEKVKKSLEIWSEMREANHRGATHADELLKIEVELRPYKDRGREAHCEVEGCAEPRYQTNRFCIVHRREYRRQKYESRVPEPRPCAYCGKTFQPLREGHRCCSPKCARLFYYREHSGFAKDFPPRACEGCGQEFKPLRAFTRFCSVRCRQWHRVKV